MKTNAIMLFLGICILTLSCEKESITPEQVDVPLGQDLYIKLESNWSTGYHWQWVNKDDVTVVDSAGITYLSEDPLLGSPGIEKWIFKSILQGEEKLKFEYRSSPGTDTLALAKQEFLIIVF